LLEAHWSRAAEAEGASRLLDVLDELIGAQLLHEHGVHYRFRHALHRRCVYESASEARRRALHAQVAASLAELGEREGELPVERVAFHYRMAGDARQAAHFLTLAGQRAASVYAHDDALRSYREALAMLEPPRDAVVRRICARLHSLIGDTNRAAGYLAESFPAYERAAALLEDLPVNAAELTELDCKIALAAIFTADMPKAGQHLARAWRHAPDDPRVHARLHVLRALHLWHFNRLEEAARYAHRALELAQSAHAEVESAQACEILAMAYLPLGRWQEGLRYEKQRLRHGRWSPELVVATDAHLCLWEYHAHEDRMLEQASAFMREVAAEADRLGDLRCVAICQYALGTIHLWKGDTAAALSELDESLALHGRVGSPAGMAYTLARRAVLHTLAGAIDPGWRSVQEGIEQAGRASIRDHCLQRLYGVGIWNRMQAKDAARVAELVAKSESLLAAGACPSCGVELYPWLALHYLEQGDPARAARCAERLEGLAAKTGNPIGETVAAIVRCGAARAQGDTPRYRDARRQAAALMQDGALKGSSSPVTYLFERMAAAP
jgi:tetratricopeptide (TPR) repeat protein